MEEELTIEDAITALYEAGATGSAIILNNMSEEDQQKIVEGINKFKDSNMVSFILGTMNGMGYFDNLTK